MDNSPLRGANGFAVSRDLNPEQVNVAALKALGRQTRKHPPAQIQKLQSSLEQFGFVLPIVIDADRRVVAGWGLVLAARKLGLADVPARAQSAGRGVGLGLRRANARVLRHLGVTSTSICRSAGLRRAKSTAPSAGRRMTKKTTFQP
jgi:hypothetical protein